MKELTIIGGGSSAHALIPMLSDSRYKVNIFTSRPGDWNKTISTKYVNSNNNIVWERKGMINLASNNPKEVIPNAEIIILCMPVYKYREALNNIAPYIDKNKKVFVGTIYGQGLFNIMVKEIIDKFEFENIITFAIGLIPWECRTKEYGKSGIIYGSKHMNFVALDKKEEFDYLNLNFLEEICYKSFNQGKFTLVDNFLTLTLSVDNQIIHTSRLYDLSKKTGGKWKNKEDIPFFYSDYTKSSAKMLKKLDDDYSLIRNKIKKLYFNNDFTYMLDYLTLDNLAYNANNYDILSSFLNSETLGNIETPVVKVNDEYHIDKNHRFFNDDIFYGLMIAKWFAENLEIKVETIDNILYWAQDILGREIIHKGKLIFKSKNIYETGIPSVYGCDNISDLIW